MVVLALFNLGNSSDAFLLLRLTDAAGSATYVPLMWAGIHVVKATVSIVGGAWSDRIGRRTVIAAGWVVYAAVYAGFAASTSLTMLLGWFLVYGFYFGFRRRAPRRRWLPICCATRRAVAGLAFGVYNAVARRRRARGERHVRRDLEALRRRGRVRHGRRARAHSRRSLLFITSEASSCIRRVVADADRPAAIIGWSSCR